MIVVVDCSIVVSAAWNGGICLSVLRYCLDSDGTPPLGGDPTGEYSGARISMRALMYPLYLMAIVADTGEGKQ